MAVESVMGLSAEEIAVRVALPEHKALAASFPRVTVGTASSSPVAS